MNDLQTCEPAACDKKTFLTWIYWSVTPAACNMKPTLMKHSTTSLVMMLVGEIRVRVGSLQGAAWEFIWRVTPVRHRLQSASHLGLACVILRDVAETPRPPMAPVVELRPSTPAHAPASSSCACLSASVGHLPAKPGHFAGCAWHGSLRGRGIWDGQRADERTQNGAAWCR